MRPARREPWAWLELDGSLRRRRGLERLRDKSRAYLWHRQLHIFLHPFYYIEYGIAQLGALQVWANSKRDKAEVIERLQKLPCPRRLEAIAGIIFRGWLSVRIQCEDNSTARESCDAGRIGEVGLVARATAPVSF